MRTTMNFSVATLLLLLVPFAPAMANNGEKFYGTTASKVAKPDSSGLIPSLRGGTASADKNEPGRKLQTQYQSCLYEYNDCECEHWGLGECDCTTRDDEVWLRASR